MSFFQQILSDIGDHQSIENQLSTYSSRLKTMKTFLEQANRKTLLLLDEFGTGSDPELGGALAEVFFEELYRKKCFAVITTHYGNIKIKADQLPNAINGCMLFDRKSLAPLYRLDMGAPGSSFTFEVAQINGIPMDLVERAKRNLKRGTVRMDELLSRLQKEKASLGQLRKSLEEETSAARKMEREFKERLDVLREKQERLSEKSSEQNDWVVKGKKLEQFVEKYGRKGKARETLEEVRRYLAMERDKKRDKAKKKQATARSKTSKTPAQKAPKMKRHLDLIQVGSQVKMDGSNLKMEVIALEDGMATLSYGSMKTKVELSRLVYMDPRKA
jgi:DNA mismatch repair protein MutS2